MPIRPVPRHLHAAARRLTLVAALCAMAGAGLCAAEDEGPIIPGQPWHVHDMKRPQPTVVTPGQTLPFTTAPSDAIVLFDGKDLAAWNGTADVADGVITIHGSKLTTKESFRDVQLHLEWAEPNPPKGSGQSRGNSGVFFMQRYELQVLDCYQNQTYPDGQTSALYGQWPPLVNACRPPGEWQTYDVVFTAPRFTGKEVASPASITAFHNGVLTQNHREYLGKTGHKVLPVYQAHGDAPLELQEHGNPVRYRNIWVRRLDVAEPSATPAPPAADGAQAH